jgi:hypothetical protein
MACETTLKGSDMKMAIESLDEWLAREKVDYTIENYEKIRNFIIANWNT